MTTVAAYSYPSEAAAAAALERAVDAGSRLQADVSIIRCSNTEQTEFIIVCIADDNKMDAFDWAGEPYTLSSSEITAFLLRRFRAVSAAAEAGESRVDERLSYAHEGGRILHRDGTLGGRL